MRRTKLYLELLLGTQLDIFDGVTRLLESFDLSRNHWILAVADLTNSII